MSDLRIPPGPGLPAGLVVPASELIERYSHSSGPGGQGVNTADSRVQLSFDIAASSVLDETQRDRLLHRLRTRLAGPVVTVVSTATRSQRQNRIDARDRLAAILREGLAPPSPPRRRTRPTKGSVERRLAAKRRRGEAKRDRSRPEAM
ncbi:peptide chain release factor 1 [Tessaracoccus lapidicaptus]|uniref:Peptide chain release factor 1 n=1 Tax=Tessaracoccus lapidicaptus TaxID=1427523 RepID=A0A1C0ARA4_9ACTN|nr:alternative ribosome rescue aminoacyl-tRNA hydrolase ArfB [Tessaracoccus lapidicaptus]OCL36954.1 peptide chain release factor 1 [Tessaracoccus lapidicaptus]